MARLTPQQIRQDILDILRLDFPVDAKRLRKQYLRSYFGRNRIELNPDDEAELLMRFCMFDPFTESKEFKDNFETTWNAFRNKVLETKTARIEREKAERGDTSAYSAPDKEPETVEDPEPENAAETTVDAPADSSGTPAEPKAKPMSGIDAAALAMAADPTFAVAGNSPMETAIGEGIRSRLSKLWHGTKKGAGIAGRGLKAGGRALGTAGAATVGALGAAGGAIGSGVGATGRAIANAKPVTKWAGALIILLLLTLGLLLSGLFNQYLVLGIPLWIGVILALFLFSSSFRQEFRTVDGILFALTMIAHIFIVTQLRTASFTVLGITLAFFYGGLAVFYAITRYREPTIALLMSILSVIAYLLPFVLDFFEVPSVFQEFASFLVMFLPIWPLYLLEKLKQDYPDGWASRTLLWFKITLFLVLLIWFWSIASIAIPSLPSFISTGDTQNNALNFIDRLKKDISGGIDRTEGTVNQLINPGEYYRGKVEQSKDDKELGVAIENLRPQDKNVNSESDIYVFGTVKAKSFTGGASVPVEPSCLIDKKGAPEGSVDPVMMDIVYGTGQSFECRFPPLEAGSYTVKASVTFPFETWAYVPYTFVDDERARNMARQGLDVKQELNIQEEPEATYTQGPVIVTMGGSSQPILVKPEGDPILSPGTRIGITIDPGWAGKLQRVESIQIKVPKPFIIGNGQATNNRCGDRNVSKVEPDLVDDQYTTYTFENTYYGPLTTWTSITCPLNIPAQSRDEARALVSTDKSVRSFIAVVNYRYSVEESTTVRVT
jgi:hypothetical protein